MYGDAEEAASEAKMYAPTGDGTAREFPVDEQLRGAFATVLEELTHARQANVYIAFRNDVDLSPPPGSEELLEDYRADPVAKAAYPDGAPVIEPLRARGQRAGLHSARRPRLGHVQRADGLGLLQLQPSGDGHVRPRAAGRAHGVRVPGRLSHRPD